VIVRIGSDVGWDGSDSGVFTVDGGPLGLVEVGEVTVGVGITFNTSESCVSSCEVIDLVEIVETALLDDGLEDEVITVSVEDELS